MAKRVPSLISVIRDGNYLTPDYITNDGSMGYINQLLKKLLSNNKKNYLSESVAINKKNLQGKLFYASCRSQKNVRGSEKV